MTRHRDVELVGGVWPEAVKEKGMKRSILQQLLDGEVEDIENAIIIPIEVKGGAGSGNWGHTGRPGLVGGSGGRGGGIGAYAPADIEQALGVVKRLALTGGDIGGIELSDDARSFLAQTVTKESYTVYRGLGLVKGRVAPENIAQVNDLRVGDEAPEFLLMKHGNLYASYTTKRSVASMYSEGTIRLVVKAKVPANIVLADLRNLETVLKDASYSDKFDAYDYDYFKSEGEILVVGAPTASVYSISGQLPAPSKGITIPIEVKG